MTPAELPLVLLIALTLWGEARGESIVAKLWVADTIYNRAHGDIDQMRSVILARKQYSCWTGNDGIALASVTTARMSRKDREAWDDCMLVAQTMMDGLHRPRSTVTHYHDISIRRPSSFRGLRLTAQWGRFRFYRRAS